MDPKPFEDFKQTLQRQGPEAAFEQMIAGLKERSDLHRVFEALTMRARYELDIPLVRATASDLPAEQRDPYEEKVIAACREVGRLFLDSGAIAEAFGYYNMIGELDAVREAIDAFKPSEQEDDSVEQVIEVAVSQGVHPSKGLALVLERYGTCQSITACEGILAQQIKPEVRQDCIKLLVGVLHGELVDRLSAEIEQHEGNAPAAASVSLLVQGRDWLFENENYHIDTSHLNSVVRMARFLPKCDETFLAIHLCEYGRRLSERYRYAESAPFENIYDDSLIFFRVLTGVDVESGLDYFRKKADKANPDEEGTYSAEVYVNLLSITGRDDEAIAYAGRKLNDDDASRTFSINELCLSAGRLDKMAQMAQRRDDLLSFAAANVQRQAVSPAGAT